MDAQDFRSLQEAYMEVVMNEGEQPYPEEKVKKSIKRKFSDVNRQRVYYSDGPRTDDLEARATKQEKIHKKMMRKVKKEQADLYDIILTHLLDEGYADTEQAAEAIMVNMSEDWRQSIVEEVFDEALTGERYKKAVKKPGGTAYSRMVSPDPAKRATRGGRGGESDFGAGDRGSGNKAARRAGTYKDKED
jgi:hypothetical protein